MTVYKYREGSYPVTYGAAQVEKIMKALCDGRSINVIGLSGTGKSNLLRFMVSHREVKRVYLRERAEDFLLIHIDCNRVKPDDEEDLYRNLIYQLCKQAELETSDFLRRASGIFELKMTLEECLETIHKQRLSLTLIFDSFGKVNEKLQSLFFDYLRYLRDINKNLSFIFATRKRLDGSHLGELAELFTSEPCWVTPLEYPDALFTVKRHEKRLGVSFRENERDKLIRYTGGHPGFLKNACELLEKGKVNLSKPEDEVARQLLQDPNIHNFCEELWGGLDLDFQSTLRRRAAGIPSYHLKHDAVQYLLQSGLFVRSQGGEAVFFCRLFELHVRDYAGAELTLLIAETNKVLRGAEEIDLTPLQFKLLSCLMEEPGRVYAREEIAQKVWGASTDDRVTPEMILRLIRRLRERINTPQHNYIQAHRGRGYEFVQGEK